MWEQWNEFFSIEILSSPVVGLIVVLSALSLFLLYVVTLISQAIRREWGWFILTLVIPIVAPIYSIYRLVLEWKKGARR